jgi:rSAM/selenodomain-associated transferase 2
MICAVLPTLNAGENLDLLLSQLSDQGIKVIVSDGGSEDNTLEAALKNDARLVLGSPGRGSQLKRGAKWAGECDWFLFIHADSRLEDGWYERLQTHIRDHPNKAGYFNLRFDSPRFAARIIELCVKIRCGLFALPYGDQALFISRAQYDAVGGYSPMALFEDVHLVQAIGRTGLRRMDGVIVTSADKFERDGYFSRGWRNFRLLRRYLKGEPIERLMKDYG